MSDEKKKDENDVQVKRHIRMLETIRARQQQGENDEPKQSGSGVSNRYAQGRASVNGSGPSVSDGDDTRDTRGPTNTAGTKQRTGETDRPDEGLHTGVRPTNGTGQRPNKSTYDGGRRTDGQRTNNRVEEKKEEREFPKFQLRNPFSNPFHNNEPAQLFTKSEADAEQKRMSEIYFYGSGFLDDILQIVVKGHEEVQIWQIDASEADTLAEMHLSRAQHDRKAAASARQLLALYDRLYLWMLALPRLKLTEKHVREHGGLSFR